MASPATRRPAELPLAPRYRPGYNRAMRTHALPRLVASLTTVLLAALVDPASAKPPANAATSAAQPTKRPFLVIAHRGASGYLPEHTLPAKVLAVQMGADAIEQDLVMTRDGELVVLHDIHLERTSDVARVFPDRARPDGRFYAIDFDLAELRRLRITEARQHRFPAGKGHFGIHTFAEEIEVLQGLARTTGRPLALYPEIKAPWFHRAAGKDISRATIATLMRYGYTTRESPVWVQCFDPRETERLRREILPALGADLKLVQLLAPTEWKETMVVAPDGRQTPYDTGWMFAPDGMRRIAGFAQGVGPWHPMIIDPEASKRGAPVFTPLVGRAHAAGLTVHPYTFRADPGEVPAYAADFEDWVRIAVDGAGVDGVFTDFPDRAAALRPTR